MDIQVIGPEGKATLPALAHLPSTGEPLLPLLPPLVPLDHFRLWSSRTRHYLVGVNQTKTLYRVLEV